MQNQLQTPPDLILPENFKIEQKKITKEDLKRKFKEFVDDNTNVERIKKQNLSWLVPGFIIQLFVADFAEFSLLADSDEYYKRFTGIAKVLACSGENTRVAEVYGTLKPGDIIYVGDDAMNFAINSKWQEWYDGQSRGQVRGAEPLKQIRKIHRWIEAGMLYLIDRGKEVVEKEGIEMSLAAIGRLQVPMVFRVPVQDVLFKIENPFD